MGCGEGELGRESETEREREREKERLRELIFSAPFTLYIELKETGERGGEKNGREERGEREGEAYREYPLSLSPSPSLSLLPSLTHSLATFSLSHTTFLSYSTSPRV